MGRRKHPDATSTLALRRQERLQQQASWWGQEGQRLKTHEWLNAQQQKCERWPSDGFDQSTLITLIETLPRLLQDRPNMFHTTVNLLKAQHPSETWKAAIQRRANMMRRDQNRSNLRGNHILLAPRKNTWSAMRSHDRWMMSSGGTLDDFLTTSRWQRKRLVGACIQLHGIQSFEFPMCHLGLNTWANALHAAKRWLNCDHPILKQARSRGLRWNLAVRRIKRLRVRGVYDCNTQMVVVDPRHPETLIHELAHMVLGHTNDTPLQQAENEVDELLMSVKEYQKRQRRKKQ